MIIDTLMVSLLSDNEIDVVAGGRGGGGGGVRPAHNNIHIKVIQNAVGGFGGNFAVSASNSNFSNIGNTGNTSTITITF